MPQYAYRQIEREEDACRILQLAYLKWRLRRTLQEKNMDAVNRDKRRQKALRCHFASLIRSTIHTLNEEKHHLTSEDLTTQKNKAISRILIALIRYQLSRSKSPQELLRSLPENIFDQNRLRLMLETEESRREALLVDKFNALNELRTIQDERSLLEKMLEEERRKLVKAKEIQTRFKSELEAVTSYYKETKSALLQSSCTIVDLEGQLEHLKFENQKMKGEMEALSSECHSLRTQLYTISLQQSDGDSIAHTPAARATRTAELRRRIRELEDTIVSLELENEQLKTGAHEPVLPETAEIPLSRQLLFPVFAAAVRAFFAVWHFLLPIPVIF